MARPQLSLLRGPGRRSRALDANLTQFPRTFKAGRLEVLGGVFPVMYLQRYPRRRRAGVPHSGAWKVNAGEKRAGGAPPSDEIVAADRTDHIRNRLRWPCIRARNAR